MSEKSQAGHVGIGDNSLPPPLTTRNLQSRLSKSLKRTAYRDASNSQEHPRSRSRSQHSSNQPSTAAFNRRVMQASAGSSSSSSKAGSSNGSQGVGGSSRVLRERRPSRATMTQPGWWSEEDIDELMSEEDSPYISHSMAESSSSRRTDSQVNRSSSSSGAVITSTSTQPPETKNAPVSSPSLRKILHPTNVEPPQSSPSIMHVATTSASAPVSTSTTENPSRHRSPKVELLSEYTCPICFFPPTNATLTPCGHICCGSCLFTAVKSTIQRGALMRAEANVARCPVCRADIPGWDGRGGGVIGLKPRTVLSL